MARDRKFFTNWIFSHVHIVDSFLPLCAFIADFNTLLNNIQDNICNGKNSKLSHSFDRYGNVLNRSFFSKTVVYRNRTIFSASK